MELLRNQFYVMKMKAATKREKLEQKWKIETMQMRKSEEWKKQTKKK